MSTAGHHQSNRIYPHLLMVKTVIQTKIECPLKTIKKANRQRIWTFINYVPIFLMLRHLPKVVQSPWFSRESHNVPAPSLIFFPLGWNFRFTICSRRILALSSTSLITSWNLESNDLPTPWLNVEKGTVQANHHLCWKWDIMRSFWGYFFLRCISLLKGEPHW